MILDKFIKLHNTKTFFKFLTIIIVLALKNGEIFFFKKSSEVNEDDIRQVYQNS